MDITKKAKRRYENEILLTLYFFSEKQIGQFLLLEVCLPKDGSGRDTESVDCRGSTELRFFDRTLVLFVKTVTW